jgi:hypothetical protein
MNSRLGIKVQGFGFVGVVPVSIDWIGALFCASWIAPVRMLYAFRFIFDKGC